jgi:hypothetical protein
MSIKFQCEHCRKEVKAPDEAAGRRGKCPFCGESNYVPRPVSPDELLPLAPVDEEEERRHKQEVRELLEQEREILADLGKTPLPPLEHREDISPADLYHHVVNYCLDLAVSNLNRAELHVYELRKFGPLGIEAVDDFISGKAIEAALNGIPTKILQAFLNQLRTTLCNVPVDDMPLVEPPNS